MVFLFFSPHGRGLSTRYDGLCCLNILIPDLCVPPPHELWPYTEQLTWLSSVYSMVIEWQTAVGALYWTSVLHQIPSVCHYITQDQQSMFCALMLCGIFQRLRRWLPFRLCCSNEVLFFKWTFKSREYTVYLHPLIWQQVKNITINRKLLDLQQGLFKRHFFCS